MNPPSLPASFIALLLTYVLGLPTLTMMLLVLVQLQAFLFYSIMLVYANTIKLTFLLFLLSFPAGCVCRRLRVKLRKRRQKSESTRRKVREKAKQKQDDWQDLSRKYERLKKTVNEMTSPCGRIVVDADDTVSLQHIYCPDNRKLEMEVKSLRRENWKCYKKLHRLERTSETIVPTPEYIQAAKCAEILHLKGQLECMEAERVCRGDDIKELQGKIKVLENDKQGLQYKNAALDRVRRNLRDRLVENEAALSDARNDQRAAIDAQRAAVNALNDHLATDLQQRIAKLQSEIEEGDEEWQAQLDDAMKKLVKVQLNADKYQAAAEEHVTTISKMRSELSNLKTCLARNEYEMNSKDLEIEQLRKSVKDEADSSAQKENKIFELQELFRTKENELFECKEKTRALEDFPRPVTPFPVDHSARLNEELVAEKASNVVLNNEFEKYRVVTSNELESLKAQIQASQSQNPVVSDAAIEAPCELLSMCRGKIAEHARLLAISDADLRKKEVDIADLSNKFQDLYDSIKTDTTSLANVTAITEDKDGKIKDLEQQVAAHITTLNQHGAEVDLLSAYYQDQVACRDATIREMEAGNRKLTDQMAFVRQERDNKSFEIRQLREDNSALQRELEDEVAKRAQIGMDAQELQDIKAYLDEHKIEPGNIRCLIRITKKLKEAARNNAAGITEMLDSRDIMMHIPGSTEGRQFPDLKSRVEAMAEVVIASSESKKDQSSTSVGKQGQMTLEKLIDMLNKAKILTTAHSVEERVKFMSNSYSDAIQTYTFLIGAGLFTSCAPNTVLGQVQFLAQDHSQLVKREKAVHDELCKRWGPQTGPNDTPLMRIKKMLAMPQYRKGEVKDY